MKYISYILLVVTSFVSGYFINQESTIVEIPVEKIVIQEVIREIPVEKIVLQQVVKEVPNTERVYITGDCSEQTEILQARIVTLLERIGELDEEDIPPPEYKITREFLFRLEINPGLQCNEFGISEEDEQICELFRTSDRESWTIIN